MVDFFETDKGMYLPSASLDSLLMVNCLQALLDAHPSVKISSVNFDEELRGYKIRFPEPVTATVFEKKYLTIGDREVWIYPLAAHLKIHMVSRDSGSGFENDLIEAIQERFGKVRRLKKLERTSCTNDWYVLVDIPEFQELNIFCREGSQNIAVSVPKWNENFKVTFFCKNCKRDGHFRHRCDGKKQRKPSTDNKTSEGAQMTEARTSEKTTPSVRNTEVQSNSGSHLRNHTGRFSKEGINRIAESIGREEVLNSGIFSEGNSRSGQVQGNKNQSNSNLPGAVNERILTDREIKKEDGVSSDVKVRINFQNAKDSNWGLRSNGDAGSHVAPKEEPASSRVNENFANSFDDRASNDDDDILFIGTTTPVNSSSRDSNATRRDGAYNSDASRSPTSASRSPTSASRLNSITEPGPSNRTYTPSKPSTRVEITSVLSDRLQECINNACDTCKILDRKTLDAFLIHVKKKSNPIRVALNFTKNPSGLKEQLQEILHIYYNTPQTGTKEDMQFIKWLNGLVSRFDGTIPRKRKRNEQNSDDAPYKK